MIGTGIDHDFDGGQTRAAEQLKAVQAETRDKIATLERQLGAVLRTAKAHGFSGDAILLGPWLDTEMRKLAALTPAADASGEIPKLLTHEPGCRAPDYQECTCEKIRGEWREAERKKIADWLRSYGDSPKWKTAPNWEVGHFADHAAEYIEHGWFDAVASLDATGAGKD